MFTESAAEPSPRPSAEEPRFVMHQVPWHLYVVMRDSLDSRRARLRLTYAEGELELMSPSPEHEESGALVGHLLAAYCDARGIDLFSKGSTTYRAEARKRGLEPDASFAFGAYKTVPDLAVEVVVSSPLLDKLDVYAGLGVPEVWVLSDGSITIHRLVGERYEPSTESGVLPGVDVATLASFVRPGESVTRLVRAYRATLG
jgi:Uma2 family endonuclease